MPLFLEHGANLSDVLSKKDRDSGQNSVKLSITDIVQKLPAEYEYHADASRKTALRQHREILLLKI